MDGCERAFRWMAYLVISAVVRSLRSCLSTVTAADLKMPPPPFSMSTPCPNAVLGSPEFSLQSQDADWPLTTRLHSAKPTQCEVAPDGQKSASSLP